MKKISILIPCYNEDENVIPMSEAVLKILHDELDSYDYEIVFIDNCSTDKTRQRIRDLCRLNPKIKAIFNARNFGGLNSPFYGMRQLYGDCLIVIPCDFQEPVELIPVFVHEWEKGAKIVCGIKTISMENKLIYLIRSCYYKLIKKISEVEQIEHFIGFGLYDKSFVDVLRSLRDPMPFLRGIVAELGYKRVDVQYEQQRRRAGKSKYNFYALFDVAMVGFTSYTKIGLRIATIGGFIMSLVSFGVALFYLIYKLIYWTSFQAGIAPIVIGVFFLGSLQLFFIGLLGEYVMSINTRVMNRPLVIEEERINFDEGK